MRAIELCIVLLSLFTVTFAVPGSDCTTDSDCTTENSHCYLPFTTCEGGTCQCNEGFYNRQNTCREKRDIGESCEFDEDCSRMTSGSTCSTQDACACDEGESHATVDGKQYCYTARAGQQCDNHQDCLSYSVSPVHGRCEAFGDDTDKTCGCVNTHNLEGEKCVAVRHEEPCQIGDTNEGMTCAGELECDDQYVCSCPENSDYSPEREDCVHVQRSSREVGETCDKDTMQPDTQLCMIDLVCEACPEDADTNLRCQQPASGAVHITSLLSVGLLSCLSVVIRQL